MERRDFMKVASVTGLSLLLPTLLSSRANADELWSGPYFLHLHAGGGWDPTLLCDAKISGAAFENRLVTGVANVGNIPVPSEGPNGQFFLQAGGRNVEDPAHFFRTVGKDGIVFNGVDTQTNNHHTGTQVVNCGHNDIALPALAALVAGTVAVKHQIPMAFVGSGPYDHTGDVVALSRFPGSKVPLLANPFTADPADSKPLLADAIVQRLRGLRAAREARLQSAASLPRTKRTLSALIDASQSSAAVSLLKQIGNAPSPSIDSFASIVPPGCEDYFNSSFISAGSSLEIVLRCFQAGLSVSATYGIGGFDTHSRHDIDQPLAMSQLLVQLRYALARATQMGIRDKLYVMVTSDFARTPKYNSGAGKDHWNVTSMLLFGPGITGARAIGASDSSQSSMRVDPNNPAGAPLPDSAPNGIRLHAGHIHHEVRRVLGVDSAPFISQFGLPPADAPIKLLA